MIISIEALTTLASIYIMCILITQLFADQSWKYSIFNQHNNHWILRMLVSPLMMLIYFIKGEWYGEK